jgi:uncharacterized membrane protein
MLGLRFASPWWLLGLVLLPLVWWHARRSLAGLGAFRRWTSLALRMLLVAATAVALAEAYWRQESREVTTVYLLDGSDSLPRAEQDKLLAYVRATSELREGGGGRRADDLGGLVVFGASASVECAPTEKFLTPEQLASAIEREHTDIAEGLRLAAASFPAGARKRIVLLSDGVETRGSAVEEARRLAELGIQVQCRPVSRGKSPEVLVERLAVRSEARVGEPVEVRAVLRTNGPASGIMHLYLDGKEVEARRFAAREAGKLPAETFVIRLPRPDFYPLELRIEPTQPSDTLTQNNVGYAFTQVPGEAKILVLYSPEGENKKDNGMVDVAALAKALASEKIAVKFAGPEAIPGSVAELAQYDCVVIANVGAYAFTPAAMKAVQAAVREMGVGLIMIGGVDSFGAGGYLNTPIEEALPVTCDVRQRKVMPNGALALIMHTCEMPDPNFWGRKISDAAIDALSDLDEAGLVYYGNNGCAWLFPIQKVGPARAQMHALIKGAQPGDMPDFDSSLKMAIAGLQKTQAAMRHIIIISDGDPSFSNVGLLGQAVAAKITVSTVAIAPHDPNCTGTLQNIANVTGGRFYHPKNPNLLPQIFVKEAMTVRRSVIFTEPFTPQWGPITPPVKGFQGVVLPSLGGYVVTTPKPRAELPLTVKLKDVEDPVLAHWQYGEGKAVAFTSTAAPDWAPKWIAWPGYGRFWSQLVRWTSRASGSSDLQVTAEVRGGEGKVIVEAMDDQGRLLNQLDLGGHAVDPLGRPQDFALIQTAPGRYEARFDAGAPGSYSIAVAYKDSKGQMRSISAGAAGNYSPEFSAAEPNPALLAEVAKVTGGRYEPMLSGDPEKDREIIWGRDLPPGYRVHPGWKWLLWLAFLLFPLDVAIRRVMVDWREVSRALRIVAGFVVPALRPAPAAGPTPTMRALKAEKERIKQSAPPPASEDVRSRFVEQLSRARAEETAAADRPGPSLPRKEDIRAAAGPALKPGLTGRTGPTRQTGPTKPPPASGISGYTAALLEAKKRALKERQEGKDKKD